MFDRFTDKAKQSMRFGRDAASESGCEYLDPEHILIGTLSVGPCRAVEILEALHIEPGALLEELQSRPKLEEPRSLGQLPFTPRSKLALEAAMKAARDAQQNWIGTEHLLAGLACTADGRLASVLLERGLTVQSICSRLTTSTVVSESEGTPPEPQGRVLDEIAQQIAALIAKLPFFRRRGD